MRDTKFMMAPLAAAFAPSVALAQATATAEEVAQQLANPAAQVTALTSQLRLQSGASDSKLNGQIGLQPVIHVELPNGRALLTRSIIPIIANGYPETAFGLGYLSLNGCFVPPPSGDWFLAFVPSVSLPTTARRSLGSRHYAAGPSAIVARQGDPITLGFLATQLWTLAQPEETTRTTTSAFQPFAAYNLDTSRNPDFRVG